MIKSYFLKALIQNIQRFSSKVSDLSNDNSFSSSSGNPIRPDSVFLVHPPNEW